jgi:glycosyltransferase involved in cell wall biosynthesis
MRSPKDLCQRHQRIDEYCIYLRLSSDYARDENLALASFNEYQSPTELDSREKDREKVAQTIGVRPTDTNKVDVFMRCPSLKELPPAPPKKNGWPWTEASSRPPDLMPDGSAWPRISVVTPSYNQGEFIEETIRSVLLQGYPNLDYIIIDGGSTDSSVQIIKKYEPWLTFWTTEKDNGQADAINKGLDRATGEIANWLNSDDLLYIGALKRVALAYCADKTADLYNGSAVRIDREGNYGTAYDARPLSVEKAFQGKIPLPQPAIFFKRGSWAQHGKLKNFYYAIDTDLFLSCIVSGHSRLISGPPVALMRIHEDAKTAKTSALRPMFLERYEIFSRLSRDPKTPIHITRHINYGLNRESLRLARVTLKDKGGWSQALLWFFRAVKYSPKKTLYWIPHVLLGNFYK